MKPTLLTGRSSQDAEDHHEAGRRKQDARVEGGRPVEGPPQRAAGGQSASLNYDHRASGHQAKSCKACGAPYIPFKPHYRKCRPCARKFLVAQRDLVKQRTADGVVAYQLRQHAAKLRSDDPEAKAWLVTLIEGGR